MLNTNLLNQKVLSETASTLSHYNEITNHAFTHGNDALSSIAPLFNRLATLSQQPKWILFTEEMPLPTKYELEAFQVNESRVIKTKASQSMSTKELLLKIINAKTTSAIVTSETFTEEDKQQIVENANLSDCVVFFVGDNVKKSLTRHIH